MIFIGSNDIENKNICIFNGLPTPSAACNRKNIKTRTRSWGFRRVLSSVSNPGERSGRRALTVKTKYRLLLRDIVRESESMINY